MSDDIVAKLRRHLRIVDHETCVRCEAALEVERLQAEVQKWRDIAAELVYALEIQVEFSRVPEHYTKPYYSQHAIDAFKKFETAGGYNA